MDDALVQFIRFVQRNKRNKVLILVLMDDALVPIIGVLKDKRAAGLNPCFNG